MNSISNLSTPDQPPSAASRLGSLEMRIEDMHTAAVVDAPMRVAAALLEMGEEVLETWVLGRGKVPTLDTHEGFRLLALQRQGARGEPSFNACRETSRELVYYYNLVASEPTHPQTAARLRLMIMIAKHLCLFVSGKMQVAGLGEFCCASKPLREGEA